MLGKSLERIIALSISDFAIDKNLLPLSQYGFRLNHSTHTQLFQIHTLLNTKVKARGCVLATFLDLCHVFETHKVWYKGLLFKLKTLKLSTAILISYLNNRTAQVGVEPALSCSLAITVGAPKATSFHQFYTFFTAAIYPSPKSIILTSHNKLSISPAGPLHTPLP